MTVVPTPTPTPAPAAPAHTSAPDRRSDDLAAATLQHEASVAVVVTDAQARAFADAGFSLFEQKASGAGARAYRCEAFVCALPVDDVVALEGLAAR